VLLVETDDNDCDDVVLSVDDDEDVLSDRELLVDIVDFELSDSADMVLHDVDVEETDSAEIVLHDDVDDVVDAVLPDWLLCVDQEDHEDHVDWVLIETVLQLDVVDIVDGVELVDLLESDSCPLDEVVLCEDELCEDGVDDVSDEQLDDDEELVDSVESVEELHKNRSKNDDVDVVEPVEVLSELVSDLEEEVVEADDHVLCVDMLNVDCVEGDVGVLELDSDVAEIVLVLHDDERVVDDGDEEVDCDDADCDDVDKVDWEDSDSADIELGVLAVDDVDTDFVELVVCIKMSVLLVDS
jgi:hypothetical protein